MLGLGVYTLLRNPDAYERLKAEPHLVTSAVDELLRYLTIFQFGLPRTAVADAEVGGRLIRVGESVTVSLLAANRDPDRFQDPDELDLVRQAVGHLAFGHGVHQCLGQHLARLELRLAFSALVRRFPDLRLAVPADDVPMSNGSAAYGVERLPVTW